MSEYHFIITMRMRATKQTGRKELATIKTRTQTGVVTAQPGTTASEVFNELFESLTVELSAGMPDGYTEQDPIILFFSLEPEELP